MMFRRFISAMLLACLPWLASAQFFLTGDDPGKVRWDRRETDTYMIIYPRGLDSLAVKYARELELWKMRTGQSIGFVPGMATNHRIPVVLHAYNHISNGSVAWAPDRMDLYTSPEAYGPTPVPWHTMLAIHEQRHVAQMQFGLSNAQRPFGWFFGQMWNGLTSGAYGGNDFMEGDAVMAETALTNSGRGRTADFLNYYMIAFDRGDWRKWARWRYGSQRLYVPDYYAFGYLTLAGIRYNYDFADFTAQFYNLASRRPYMLGLTGVKKISPDGKRTRDLWTESAQTFYSFWKENADARAPYMPSEQIVPDPKFHSDYTDLTVMDDGIYAVRKSLDKANKLVRIGYDGTQTQIRPFATYTGMLYHSSAYNLMFWSEDIGDPRWSLRSHSAIRRMNQKGKITTLTKKGSFYNPSPSPTEGHIAASQYLDNGTSRLAILSSRNGKVEAGFDVPDSLQLVETAWIGDKIYATMLSDSGYGVYHLHIDNLEGHDADASDGEHPWDGNTGSYQWHVTLAPSPVVIKNFGYAPDGHLMFTSDRSGVDEMYEMDPDSGDVWQCTSTRYGASEFQYSIDGKWLYYSANTYNGKLVSRTSVDSLMVRKVDFSDRYAWKIADRLSEQDRALADAAGIFETDDINISESKHYSKFGHLFKVHSWAPVYFNVDNIMNMSYDHVYDLASVGVAAISQNSLSTAVSNFGYSFHPDPDGGKWRHSGHFQFTYSGWYPVLEAKVDFNDRLTHYQSFGAYTEDGKSGYIAARNYLGHVPYTSLKLSAYIPWTFNSGGWYRGFIPEVTYNLNNDTYSTNITWYMTAPNAETGEDEIVRVLGTDKGKSAINQSILATARGYIMQGTASSGVYPRFGLGAEVGVYRPLGLGTITTKAGELDLFGTAAFAYAYAYLPGFTSIQGFRLTAKYQTILGQPGLFPTGVVNTLPRGMTETPGLFRRLIQGNSNSLALTADYAIPVHIGDLCLWNGFLYARRMVLTPHFDFTTFGEGNLWSAGMDVNFDLSAILWMKVPVSIGIRYDYNGGSAFNQYLTEGVAMDHHYVGPLFTVDF